MPLWDRKNPPKYIPEYKKPDRRFNESGYWYVRRYQDNHGQDRTKSELLVTIGDIDASTMTGKGIPRFVEEDKLPLLEGYAYLVNEDGNYYVDQDGNFIITETF